MQRIQILLIALLMVFARSSYGAFSKDDIGTGAAQFLKIGVGARALGMGEAYGAVGGDVNSSYWNPAGLAAVEKSEFSIMHCQWFENIKYNCLSFAQPSKIGAVALSVNYLSIGDIDKFDNQGNDLGESFAPYDMAATLSYSRYLGTLSFGVNLKYILSAIENERASAVAMDAGLLLQIMQKRLSLGLVAQNGGSSLKYIKEEEQLPLNVKAATAYKISAGKDQILLALDVNFPRDNEARLNGGLEYKCKVAESIFVSPRAGYKTNNKGQNGTSGITAGVGFAFGNYIVDYAWNSYGDLGQINIISLSIKF